MTTLAIEKIRKEKFRAVQAREAFGLAHANSLTKEEAGQIRTHIHQAIDQAMSRLSGRLVTAIGSETDETQIHYLLSDILHDWLKELGHSVQQACSDPQIGRAFARAITPKDLLSVSQWAERYRMLSTGTNLPGPWRNSNAPHATEIMDSLSEHSPVRTVTFMKASGISGTEMGLNWLGYVIDHVQKDIMFVVPTLELRDRTFNPKIKRLITETPSIAQKISTASRDETNRKDMLEIGPMRVIKSGANSPDSLRAEHIPYVYGDEIDAYPANVGNEGDPLTLIDNRQKTFSRAKTFLTSTPTLKGFSLIEKSFYAGDQRYRHVPCPHCNQLHKLEFKHFKFKYLENVEPKQIHQAWFVCPNCNEEIHEHHKNGMLDAGVWIAEKPEVKRHRSYHLNSFYIKFGLGLSWKDIAQKWVDAQGDTEKLISFTNTYLAETWSEEGEQIDANSLLARIEHFPEVITVQYRTAGVDVQKDRLEASIIDWEESEECWVQYHLIIDGDTSLQDVWDELDDSLIELGVQLAFIDSGYNTQMVYDFCQKRRWCNPIKGVGGMGRPLIEDKTKRNQRLRRRRKKGMPVEPIGVDQGKHMLHSRLKLANPTKIEFDQETGEITRQTREPAPKYIHFKVDAMFDDEYFAQLTAEQLVTRKRAGREYQEWKPTRPRNETQDCWIYAFAAFRLAQENRMPAFKGEPQRNTPNAPDQQTAAKPTKPAKRPRRTLKL